MTQPLLGCGRLHGVLRVISFFVRRSVRMVQRGVQSILHHLDRQHMGEILRFVGTVFRWQIKLPQTNMCVVKS